MRERIEDHHALHRRDRVHIAQQPVTVGLHSRHVLLAKRKQHFTMEQKHFQRLAVHCAFGIFGYLLDHLARLIEEFACLLEMETEDHAHCQRKKN